MLTLPLRTLTKHVLAAALLCAGGATRPPSADALARLMLKLEGEGRLTAVLSGARIEQTGTELRVMREPGEQQRSGLAPLPLDAGVPTVWDGRFELSTDTAGLTVVPLAGHAARLAPAERAALRPLPAAARASLPALIDSQGRASLPAPFGTGPASARSLVRERFDAALGLMPDERTLAARAEPRARASRPHGAGDPITLS